MVVQPLHFYGRDHSGSKLCDGLFATAHESVTFRGMHFRRQTAREILDWLEAERKRYT